MSNLDKLMKKLKNDEPVKAEVVETPKVEEPKAEEPTPIVAPTPVEVPQIDDDEDEEDEVKTPTEEVEKSEPVPANVDDSHTPDAEVGLLQNNGIFRREMLLIEKEKVDVLKVIAQTILDIKKKLTGEDDGKKD